MISVEMVFEWLSKGWVGILIGTIIAYVFYRKSLGVRRITYERASIELLGPKHPELAADLVVTYRGKPVPRLRKATVVMWNDGNTLIPGTDIVAGDPIRVEVEDGEILQVNEPRSTRSVINFRVERPDGKANQLVIGFDFLDVRDGFRIELLHTADEASKLKVLGTVRGMPEGFNRYVGWIPTYESREGKRTPVWRRRIVWSLVVHAVAATVSLFFSIELVKAFFPDFALSVWPKLGEPMRPPIVAGEIDWRRGIASVGMLVLIVGAWVLFLITLLGTRRFPRALSD